MYNVEKQIRLYQLAEVEEFVNIASKYRCNIQVRSNNSITSGRSILGIASLALWHPIIVSACGADAEQFVEGLSRFRSQ